MRLGVGIQQAEGDFVPCQGSPACEALAQPPPLGAQAVTELPRAAGPAASSLALPSAGSGTSAPTHSECGTDPIPEQPLRAKGRPGGCYPRGHPGTLQEQQEGDLPTSDRAFPGPGNGAGCTFLPRLDFKCRRASGPSWPSGTRSERAAAMELAVKDITCVTCRRRVRSVARSPPALTRALRCFPT